MVRLQLQNLLGFGTLYFCNTKQQFLQQQSVRISNLSGTEI